MKVLFFRFWMVLEGSLEKAKYLKKKKKMKVVVYKLNVNFSEVGMSCLCWAGCFFYCVRPKVHPSIILSESNLLRGLERKALSRC